MVDRFQERFWSRTAYLGLHRLTIDRERVGARRGQWHKQSIGRGIPEVHWKSRLAGRQRRGWLCLARALRSWPGALLSAVQHGRSDLPQNEKWLRIVAVPLE